MLVGFSSYRVSLSILNEIAIFIVVFARLAVFNCSEQHRLSFYSNSFSPFDLQVICDLQVNAAKDFWSCNYFSKSVVLFGLQMFYKQAKKVNQ